MFPHHRLGALPRVLFLAASIVFVTWQLPALAQSADPSDRIATITDAAGNLSFAPAGSDDWAQAGLNRPITTGDRLWVDNDGRAELHAGSTAIRLGSGTAVTMLNLDDSTTQVKLTQGTLQLRARALPPDQPVEIDTPNLAFVPKEPGDYRLDVAADGSGTVVTMHHGSAVVYGDNRSLEMRRGDQIRFAGTDLAETGSATNPPLDSFDSWTMARDAREDNSPSARYVPPEMTGYAELDNYGDWQENPGYGAVWFPRVVAADWAPYSAGYWAWVAPWGWTWCDDAPWGFAPSHYGRWARIGNRWGWMPGPRSVQPVYAPALVGFIGDGHGHDHDRGRGPGVAWYPLGPREAYRPAYGASPAYVNRINRFSVNNEVINNRIRNTYVNRDVPGAITAMPARAFVQGQRVSPGARGPAWRDVPRGEANGAPPLAPVQASLHGAAPARAAPPAVVRGFERAAIAVRAPGRPASDELAQRLARTGGTVPGAGPAWRGAGNAPGGNRAAAAPVRLSQAAPAYHGRNGAGQMQGGPVTQGAPGGNAGNPAFGPQRAEGGVRPPAPQGLTGAEHGIQPPPQVGDPRARGWTTRPDQGRGQSAAQPRQAQQAMQEQQEMQRQQQQRQLGDQQRAQQSVQQQQEMQRQQQQRQLGDQQRAQQAMQQQQEMQRQQQQRQMQDQQRQQQAMQQQAIQQQAMQRQQQEQQRQQQAVQRQQQEMQRQQQEQQRQQQLQQQQQQQQQQQVMQRQQQDQQRQQQEMQRQQQDHQRQQQEQQRRLQDLQRQQQHAAAQPQLQRQS